MSTGGLSKARLGRMHDVMAGYVERGEVPGLVTLVSRRGEVHVDAIGTKALGGSDPMRRDTIFRISSMTKPITAAAAMILVEECKLRLDEPVDRLLPELADRQVLKRLDGPLDDTVPANRPITVRDLLTFRLGFGLMMAPPDAYPILKAASELQIGMGPPSPATLPAPDEWMRRLGTLPLMHQPGEQWMYNTRLRRAGRADRARLGPAAGDVPARAHLRAARHEGHRLQRAGRRSSTGWRPATGPIPRPGRSRSTTRPRGGQWSRPPAFPSGAGGLVSTVDDYLAFGQMMLNKGKHGGERILSRPSVETMTTDQLTPEQKAVSGLVPGFFDSRGWGFGVSVVTRRDDLSAVARHASAGTAAWARPGTRTRSEDMVAILMTQRAWTSPSPPDVCLDFWTSAYQAIDD